jgi:hypothetical protein
MYPSVEVRWFQRGAISNQVLTWFLELPGSSVVQPIRVDYYFLSPEPASIGVKLREGKFEIKLCTQKYGEFQFHPRIAGFVEAWIKWSFIPEEYGQSLPKDFFTQPYWFGVEKQRRMRKYRIVSEKKVLPAPADTFLEHGCEFELTDLLIKGKRWWSLGFEAHGNSNHLFEALVRTANYLLLDCDGIILRPENSYSYPHWLQEML